MVTRNKEPDGFVMADNHLLISDRMATSLLSGPRLMMIKITANQMTWREHRFPLTTDLA